MAMSISHREYEEEEQEEQEEGERDRELSIPRGGPVYIANLITPLTRVPHFETSVLDELQKLEAELCYCSYQPCDEEKISVDELRVYTEEDLLNMALKDEANAKPIPEEDSGSGREGILRISNGEQECSRDSTRVEGDALALAVSSKNGSQSHTSCNETENQHKSRKRIRMCTQNHAIEDGYMAKVEKLVNIKKRQDEERAEVKLHSFSTTCKTAESVSSSSEKVDKMKSTLRSTNPVTKLNSSSSGENSAVRYPEVVLAVEVYHNKRKSVKTQEFLMLGRQILTELRDKIYCLTDQIMQKAGHNSPSGYFLIEDVFYNDMRDPSAIDYSEPVLDWLRNSKDDALKKWEAVIAGELKQKQKAVVGDVVATHLPHFRANDMHKVRFSDLPFRLGEGYLYCHQGNCKHSFVIRDMRLIHPEDVNNRAAYPIITFQLKVRVCKCSICKIYRATKVTVDDKLAQENPCYFCEDCYFLLHHSKDGSLTYSDFLVYDYLYDQLY